MKILPFVCLAVSAANASAVIINVSTLTGVDFTGGRAANGDPILVGGQNGTSPAIADKSGDLSYSTDGSITQTYAVMMNIGISNIGEGNARGFQFTQQGEMTQGVGPNFRFIEGHDGGSFAFSSGQQGANLIEDDSMNSWSFNNAGEAPQLNEVFSISFQVDFYYPGQGDQNNRQFDYTFAVTRSDPNNTVVNDTLTFTTSKVANGTNFINDLGKLHFRGSGNGDNGNNILLATLSDVVVANEAIPEPSTSLILVLGGVCLGFRRKRK